MNAKLFLRQIFSRLCVQARSQTCPEFVTLNQRRRTLAVMMEIPTGNGSVDHVGNSSLTADAKKRGSFHLRTYTAVFFAEM